MRRLTDWLIDTPLIAALLAMLMLAAGLYVAPFRGLVGEDTPRNPVPVDAIPDVGENQQIVFTRWPGHSPQDVDDQVTYPLAQALLGLPGIRTVRSYSYFGYSTVFVVFEDAVEFYWSRSRLLEKLSALPPGTLPSGVRPELGPDATGLGQVFWYTVEAPHGAFDLHELRGIQDWTIRPALQGVPGVAEVAGVGGHTREFQVEVDPEAMRMRGVTLGQVADAVRRANVDVGARTLEVNRVEYVVRGVGRVDNLDDLREAVVLQRDHVPVTLADVAHVTAGPATRRGVLDRAGAEVVGGVVVVRYGVDPLVVIERVKETLAKLAPALPERSSAEGPSKVRVVPFYDRTELIHETIGTLEQALGDQILVTVLVIVLMTASLRASFLVSMLLPLAVLLSFVGMRLTGVGANVMSLAGVAIAIGTMVDTGIILAENVMRHRSLRPLDPLVDTVKRATGEVGGAILTAVATTVIGFLPVFALTGPEAKLFHPLAWTKTYALVSAIVVALLVLPAFAGLIFRKPKAHRPVGAVVLAGAGIWALVGGWHIAGACLIVFAVSRVVTPRLSERQRTWAGWGFNTVAIIAAAWALAVHWQPLGPATGALLQLLFVAALVGGVIGSFWLFIRVFPRLLGWFLDHKLVFSVLPLTLVATGLLVWMGGASVFGEKPHTRLGQWAVQTFPGLEDDFMPPFDEGSFLWMPTTMPHASLGEALDVLQLQDRAIASVPEVRSVVGKIGRVDSALDPAPLSMVETIIDYHPEFGPPDPKTGVRPRLWRDHIKSPNDIWQAIVEATALPGTTSAPKLQPIAARIVMLQSGMRASMGVKVRGQSLADIAAVADDVERLLSEVPGVAKGTVLADRVVGKPYLEIHIDRAAIARYGLSMGAVQQVIEVAIGGRALTTVTQGRERIAVRVRYPRERRVGLETIDEILVPTPGGAQVPLGQLSEVQFVRGPMVIKSEDSFLVGYVTFDAERGRSPAVVVDAARAQLDGAVAAGTLKLPEGAGYHFAGQFENQVRVERTLRIVLPFSLLLIFGVLYLQFRKVSTALLVFSGIAVAWAGGFVLLWLYAQPGFLNFAGLRELFNVGPVDLTVAVWVGFLALFGIASDDGVVISTYLEQALEEERPKTVAALRAVVITAASRRVRPCLMTTATTLLALLPVITSDGRGADVMRPMALPTLGGMVFALLTLFVVPVGWSAWNEARLRWGDA
jgi:Cu(I)/Ag(I) efflux system membrane protein CusA/SilA